MCPTLDPIENTPAKAQIVPQFNKKEIYAVVNDGIEKGLINAAQSGGDSGGGTKLYQHKFAYSDDYMTYRVILFDNNPSEINADNLITRVENCVLWYSGTAPDEYDVRPLSNDAQSYITEFQYPPFSFDREDVVTEL